MTVGTAGAGPSGAAEGEYASNLFERFEAMVARLGPEAEVLDLGPTMPSNLMFWARRGHKIAAYDYVARRNAEALDSSESVDRSGLAALDALGRRGRRFGGILCWTVMSLLPPREASELVGWLSSRLIPSGTLFAIFDGDGRGQPSPLRYSIVGADRLRFEPSSAGLTPRAVPTSEIEEMFRPLRPTRISVLRHGSREAMAGIAPIKGERLR